MFFAQGGDGAVMAGVGLAVPFNAKVTFGAGGAQLMLVCMRPRTKQRASSAAGFTPRLLRP